MLGWGDYLLIPGKVFGLLEVFLRRGCAWIPSSVSYKISGVANGNDSFKVSDYIDSSNRTWRVGLLRNTFSMEDVDIIL